MWGGTEEDEDVGNKTLSGQYLNAKCGEHFPVERWGKWKTEAVAFLKVEEANMYMSYLHFQSMSRARFVLKISPGTQRFSGMLEDMYLRYLTHEGTWE